MSFIVAIDGPAGAGKGTITKLVGEHMNLSNIDTGATYRCVTLAILNEGINLEEEEKIKKLLQNIKIEITQQEGKQQVLLNGEDVTLEIRMQNVNDRVSAVSALKVVRDSLVKLQRKMAEGKDVIMEGRDIGTNVFPNANLKIYLDASAEERARRRVKQEEEKGIKTSYEMALENIKARDKMDSEREITPLKKAEDAIYIDTTNMTIEEVVQKIVKEAEMVKEKAEKNK